MIDVPQEERFGAGTRQAGFWRGDAAGGQVFWRGDAAGGRSGFWRGDAASGQVFGAGTRRAGFWRGGRWGRFLARGRGGRSGGPVFNASLASRN